MTLVQIGGDMSAQEAGLLTLGYAIAIVAFIRVGEKLLQRFGPRKPMSWEPDRRRVDSAADADATSCSTPTRFWPSVAFTLFGIGLAFYATPSTDAALSNLPDNQAGAGRASTRWLHLSAHPSAWPFRRRYSRRSAPTTADELDAGRDHLRRPAGQRRGARSGVLRLPANLLMVVAAIVAIVLTVPKGPAQARNAHLKPELGVTVKIRCWPGPSRPL